MKKKRDLLLFAGGLFAVTIGLPLSYAAGVPPFDVLLRALFGEGSLWAIAFSALLIGTLLSGFNRLAGRSH